MVPTEDGGWIEIMPDGTITMYDPDGNVITTFGPDGSYHAELEEYAGGIRVPFDDGGYLEILPDFLHKLHD